MPTIKYNKKTILELLGRKISDEQLGNRISFLGTGFEGINNDEIEVEIFPNRPDLLSEQGMARALASFMDIKKGFKKYDVKKSGVKVVIDKSVKGIRPYTACAIVKGLKLSDERIKDPEEIRFKPLDLNKDLTGSQILAIHPTGREYGYLLEGKERYPVFIDSKQSIMSMPPIINSNTVGKITAITRDVFIECSGFDFDYLHTCLNIVVTALADMGGQIFSVELVYPEKKYVTPDLNGREIKLDVDYVNKILGLDFKESDVKEYLALMGYDYKNRKALVPNYRADILHPIDLIEDIAIAYGYENFNGALSKVSSTAQEKPIEIFKNNLRNVLIGLGLIEVKNYHLTNKDAQSKLMNYPIDVVELENSVTQDYNVLRAWIIPNLLETLKNNKHYDYPQNIFESGIVFKLDDSFDTGVHETERICVALCGNDANFTKIKQVLDVITEALNIKYDITDTEHSSFIKGRVGRVVVDGSKIAYIGEVHPQVLCNWALEMPVAVLEINVTELFRTMHLSNEKGEKNAELHPDKIQELKSTHEDVQKHNQTQKHNHPEKLIKPSAKSKVKSKPAKKILKSKSKSRK